MYNTLFWPRCSLPLQNNNGNLCAYFLLFLLMLIFSYSKYICCSSYIVSLSHVVIVIMPGNNTSMFWNCSPFFLKQCYFISQVYNARLATDFARQSSQFKRPWISDRVNKLGVFPSSGRTSNQPFGWGIPLWQNNSGTTRSEVVGMYKEEPLK
jgi:hypothetical protein